MRGDAGRTTKVILAPPGTFYLLGAGLVILAIVGPFHAYMLLYYNRYNGRSPDPKGNLHAEKVPEWVNSSARKRK